MGFRRRVFTVGKMPVWGNRVTSKLLLTMGKCVAVN